ncbi:unnamed protein product [Rotaria magnacalcarata]|uniref:Uncharacterized protein n=1 Tax=Rotaria magnacalcarata TaxID=392030 RepID=A0A820LGX3_9BILA|nr:unnamed protein product [Rotaria magnacalcarata]
MESKILLKQANGSHLWHNVRVQQAIFDLPARAHLLNIVQYNGYDGCGDCFIKGVTIGRQVSFSFSGKSTGSWKKGSTPLSTILQLPAQAPYDSMHLIYHGHVKTLLKEWHTMFGKQVFEDGSFFLSNTILSHSFKYQFLSLSDFPNWKAKMLRDFFLICFSSFCCLLFTR